MDQRLELPNPDPGATPSEVAASDAQTKPSGPPPPGGAHASGHRQGLLDRLSDRQMTVGVLLFGLLLYLPFAGTYGLFDPWETHYAEVARQMTARGDYISLWWPGAPLDADHFWSKPVLSFWLMSLFMHLFGVVGGAPGTIALGSRAEWAARVPFCLMGVLGLWAVYLCLSRFVGRRAGVIGVVVLATSPLYALVARQAMTDMAFVGPMTMALALGALALFDDQDQELPRRTWGRWSWPHHPLFYTAVGVFAIAAVPQLIVDSVQLSWPVHLGGGAFVIPGVVIMLPYWAALGAFVRFSATLRFRAPLYLAIAATLCGLATLAKGLAGLGLPVIIFVSYLLFTWNWRRLQRAQIGRGLLLALLVTAIVAVPWHQSMLVRHGFPFWDELYGDNHWRRLVLGRHGDRGTFEYFLRELGYAVLPWAGLAPAALATVAMRPVREVRRQGMFWFGAIWFVAGYTLVSLSVTKFHHYILPAVPGLAIALACFLDDLIDRRAGRVAAAAAIGGASIWALVTFDLVSAKNSAQHFIWLFSYDYINAPKGRPWPESLDFRVPLGVFAAAFALCTAGMALRRLRRGAVVGLCGVAVMFTFYLLDGYMRATAPFWSQKHLVATYYRTRRSPEEKLLVWQMYWRGENFYTANEIYEGPAAERTVFLGDKNVDNLKDWVARHRGRRAFFLVERSRWGQVPGMMPPETQKSLRIIDETNMKFVLGQIDL